MVIRTRLITVVTGVVHTVIWREWNSMNFLHVRHAYELKSDTVDGQLCLCGLES